MGNHAGDKPTRPRDIVVQMIVRGDRRGWEMGLLFAFAAAFVIIRLPLYTQPGLILGWNSDAALFGLMARAMRTGRDFPIFFWGQHYLGTMTSTITAVIGMTTGEVGPLELRISSALEVAAGALFFWLGLRRAFGRAAADLSLLWLIAGPSFLFHFTIAPIGAEQLFLVAGLLFWYAIRTPFDRWSEWFVIGLIAGCGTWIHQGILFLVPGIAVALLLERAVNWRRVIAAMAGAVAGYSPAMVALLRHDPVLYRRTLLAWDWMRPFENLFDFVRSDLWSLLADLSWIGIATGAIILIFAILGLVGQPPLRPFIIIASTLIVSAGFWIFTTYPYPGAVRYIVPTVPMIYGAAAAGIIKHRWRVIASIAAASITLGLYVPRIRQVRDVAAGRAERYTNWPGDFDPRPTVARLRSGRFEVCYGEVWVAHKLEWITSPTVRFVPVVSVHRTLAQSLELIHRPGTKCFVGNDGNVTALTPAQDAWWAATVEDRARKAGLRPRYR